MNQIKINNKDSKDIKKIICSLDLLKNGYIRKAEEVIKQINKKNKEIINILNSLKFCNKIWKNKLNKIANYSNYEKGKKIIEEWVFFEKEYKEKKFNNKVLNNLQYYLLNLGLNYLQKSIDNELINIELLFLIGFYYKKLGNYEKALFYYKKAVCNNRTNSNFIAQLADLYALIDQEEKAKILFKEAFFMDPDSINIEFIDSDIIKTIISKILEDNNSIHEIKYWIPVYGRIYNILNINREVLLKEYKKIKEEIIILEDEIKKNNNNLLKAKLINNYLWLIDFYKQKKINNEEIILIKNNIKFLSENIYYIFMKNEQE